MRFWSRKKDEVHQLAKPFFSNDPYYPRPRFADPLYQKFHLGYLKVRPKRSYEAAELAEAFLRTIETEQTKRDSGVRVWFVFLRALIVINDRSECVETKAPIVLSIYGTSSAGMPSLG